MNAYNNDYRNKTQNWANMIKRIRHLIGCAFIIHQNKGTRYNYNVIMTLNAQTTFAYNRLVWMKAKMLILADLVIFTKQLGWFFETKQLNRIFEESIIYDLIIKHYFNIKHLYRRLLFFY